MKKYKDENGLYHREDGPAIEHANGYKAWYWHGEYHREDGPAIEHANGYKAWYWHGKLHREDGPAIEHANGYKAWFYHRQRIDCQSNQEFLRLVKLKAFW
jgi:hypothetical protein